MKRISIVLATAGAFAGVAHAQTSVTVYGILDAGITRETGDAGGNVWKMATGVQSGNRLGFKGAEDLGGGLKANFQVESGFDLDTGTLRQGGSLFGRQSWVGLSGGFGAVSLGRQYNPLFVALDAIDPFSTGLTGATTNLMNPSSVRTNNSIAYYSPVIGGFGANFLYGLGEVTGDPSRARTYGVSLGYTYGPLTLAAAYDNANNGSATTPLTNTTKLSLVGGTYKFGPATLHLAYEREKDDAGTDFRDVMVGLSAAAGAGGNVLASFIDKRDKSAAGDRNAKQYAIGYIYAMSKRSNLYTSYGRIRNSSAAAFTVGDASSGGSSNQAPGATSSGFTVGMRHIF
jgi:predicted porin